VDINKTKFMILSKEKKENCQLLIKNIPEEREPKFAYIGITHKKLDGDFFYYIFPPN
jgi:hypothetical protein